MRKCEPKQGYILTGKCSLAKREQTGLKLSKGVQLPYPVVNSNPDNMFAYITVYLVYFLLLTIVFCNVF